MSEKTVYEYAVIRVVPRVEREEFVNVGIAFFCKKQRYAAVKLHLCTAKCKALDPTLEMEMIATHLESFRKICAGDRDAGGIAQLDQAERFRWLTAKRSTIIQCAAVHPGICEDAEQTHQILFEKLIL